VLLLCGSARAEEFPRDRGPGLTLGLAASGSLASALYGENRLGSSFSKGTSGIGGGGTLTLQLGYYFKESIALISENQLSLQQISVRNPALGTSQGLNAFNSLFTLVVRGHVWDESYLLGGVGLALGYLEDVDRAGQWESGLGPGFTVGGGYEFFRRGSWGLTADFRFAMHVFPASELKINLLQWTLGIGVHRYWGKWRHAG
jgi:hypothetical protein